MNKFSIYDYLIDMGWNIPKCVKTRKCDMVVSEPNELYTKSNV